MKNRPLHENLDTSFVNLSALVKYLRRRLFTGQIRIELSGYEADIYLTAENQLKVREYDHIAGRVAEGAEALQRILIRSREPGGIVNVYQAIAESESVEKKASAIVETPAPASVPKEASAPLIIKTNGANAPNGAGGKPKTETPARRHLPPDKVEAPPPTAEKPAAPQKIFQNVPFEFTNRVEARAKQPVLSAAERESLLALTGELLGAVDHVLALAKLDFPGAFQKARTEIAADYPFLKTLDYDRGKIRGADANTNPKLFVAGVLEALRRLLERLAANPKFAEAHRCAVQRILALIHQRRPFYDKFFITQTLEKILGA